MIKINLNETYDHQSVEEGFFGMTFYSPDTNQANTLIKVELRKHPDAQLENVYNLAFGPLNKNNMLDDKAKVKHADTDKMFSTVLLFGLTFLDEYPGLRIGLDGSSDSRAYLYHRMFQTNRNHLNEYLVALGVDWFVRLLRNGDVEREENGSAFFKPKPEFFNYERTPHDLYNYYIFFLRKAITN